MAELGQLSTSALDKADLTNLPIDATAAALLIATRVTGAVAAARRVTLLTRASDLAGGALTLASAGRAVEAAGDLHHVLALAHLVGKVPSSPGPLG